MSFYQMTLSLESSETKKGMKINQKKFASMLKDYLILLKRLCLYKLKV
ncbi:hypothetical protein BSPA14S_K0010 (plasmid) [Borreliella spielmanii A14S]|uniref:Uncharacterized protein n=1 Tax=Borreliella spielmanii A14S TaxID=498742 RepID=C0RBS0_9SPIR|nr:hypothetical protein BSPA14S_K0010 [Borreliella spielmanii A14S]